MYVTPQAEYGAMYPKALYNNPKNDRDELALVMAWVRLPCARVAFSPLSA